MSAALAWLEDDLPTPRRARHLYLVAVDGCMVASDGNRRHAACMRTGTSALPANNNKKHSFRDVRELITSVVEENREFDKTGKPLASGKTPIATRYVYDPLKQITQVIDYK